MDYQLLDEKWIPVLYQDGRFERIGILKAFSDAGRIRQIAANNPMDRFAVLRFMLALLYWCKGNPPESDEFVFKGSFPEEWFKKLDDKRDLFNLLGNGKRFYQIRPSNDTEKSTINYLAHEVPTGTNYNHFRHSIDKVDGLCPACCALGLLRLPVFSTAGGSGKSPGINSKPPFYFFRVGKSLAETLWLSWEKIPHTNFGIPTWEDPNLELLEVGEIPLFTGLTWLPRRVWLNDPDISISYCILCGNMAHLIKDCIFEGKGSLKKYALDKRWTDPNVIYINNKILKPGDVLNAHDAEAGQWLKVLQGIIDKTAKDEKMVFAEKIWIIGFATVKNDKYLETIEYEIPAYQLLSIQNTEELQNRIRIWINVNSNVKIVKNTVNATRLQKKKNESKEVPKKSNEIYTIIKTIINAIRPQIEFQISARKDKLLLNNDNAWINVAKEYGSMLGVISESLFPGYTTASLKRRMEIPNNLQHILKNEIENRKPSKKE